VEHRDSGRQRMEVKVMWVHVDGPGEVMNEHWDVTEGPGSPGD
jgi:hypothetical protein